MSNYETMEDKYDLGNEVYCHKSKIDPNKVILLIEDAGGQMPCRTHVVGVSCFDSLENFCGYLFFSELPRILSWSTHFGDQIEHEPARLIALTPEDLRGQVKELFDILEAILKSEIIDVGKVVDAADLFNAIFENTEPRVQILAWGENLHDLLLCPDMNLMLEEDAEQDEENIAAPLKKLLDNNEFSMINPEHVKMAVEYIESKTDY